MILIKIKREIIIILVKLTNLNELELNNCLKVQANSLLKPIFYFNLKFLLKLLPSNSFFNEIELKNSLLSLEEIERIEFNNGYCNIFLNPQLLLKQTIDSILDNSLTFESCNNTLLINTFKLFPAPILLHQYRQSSIISSLAKLLSLFESKPTVLHFVRDENWVQYFKFIKLKGLQKSVNIELWDAFRTADLQELGDISLTEAELEEFNQFKTDISNNYSNLGLFSNHDKVRDLDEKFCSNHLEPLIHYLETNAHLEIINKVTRLDLSQQNFNMPALLDEKRNATCLMNQYLRLIQALQESRFTRVIWVFPIKEELLANQLRCLINLTKPILIEIIGSGSDALNNIVWYPIGSSELSSVDIAKLDSNEYDPLFNKIHSNMKRIIEEDTLKLEELELHKISLEKVYNLDNLQTGNSSIDLIETTSKKLAASNLIIQLLSLQAKKTLRLSIEDLLTTKGLSGIYFQYTFARLCGIARKTPMTPSKQADLSLIVEREALQLALILADYPLVLMDCYNKLELQPLVSYAFRVSKELSNCNRLLRVKGMRVDLALSRLTLLHCVKLTLENSFNLLNLEGVEKM